MIKFHLNERYIHCKLQTSPLCEPGKNFKKPKKLANAQSKRRRKKKLRAQKEPEPTFSREAVEFLQHPAEDNLTLCGGQCNLLWWWDRCKNAVRTVPEKIASHIATVRHGSLQEVLASLCNRLRSPTTSCETMDGRWTRHEVGHSVTSAPLCSLYAINDQLMLHSVSEIGLKDCQEVPKSNNSERK